MPRFFSVIRNQVESEFAQISVLEPREFLNKFVSLKSVKLALVGLGVSRGIRSEIYTIWQPGKYKSTPYPTPQQL